MLEVRRCEVKERRRGVVREVDGDVNPSRLHLVFCRVVALGVVLVEEVGAGVRDVARKVVWLGCWLGGMIDHSSSRCSRCCERELVQISELLCGFRR